MQIKVSTEELRILTQVLNEICHGVNLNNFEQRIGTNKETSKKLLENLDFKYENIFKNYTEDKDLIILFNIKEIMIIKNSIDAFMRFFDESDFNDRLGCTKDAVKNLQEKLICVQGK